IVITDYADNLQRIGRIIAGVDTPPSADGDVVPLQYALAVDVAPLVQRLVEPAQGGAVDPGQRVTVLADPRTNTVVLRASSPARIASAKGLIARLDVPTATAGNIHIVNLKNAEAVKLAGILRSVISGDSSALSPTSSSSSFAASAAGTANPIGIQQNQLSAPPPGVPPGAAPSSYGSQFGSTASTIANPFASSSSGGASATGGIIQADPATNSLIITAPDPIYRNLRAIIETLDVRRPQVFIEALIVEVTADRAAEFGIQWQDFSGINNRGTNVIGGTNFGGVGTNIIGASISPLTVGQGLNVGIVKGTINIPGIGTITNLALLARALETDNNANILSTPNLLTLDNEEAQIIVGQQVPFVTGQYAQTGGANSVTPFQTIERRDVGLTLKIKPTIADNGTVKLLIYQGVSSIVNATLSSPAGPTTNKRAISTVVQPEDGQFVVLGGLIQDNAQNGVSQVPVLGSIPYIGGLFRYQNRTRSKTNLLVILRPYIVRDSTANGIFADKYDLMRKVQIDAQPPPSSVLPDNPGSVLPPRDETPAPGSLEPFRAPMTKPGASNTAPNNAPGRAPVDPATKPATPPSGTTQ
ncbi:MAG: type II secretion system secretin GspD, partial [Burkholderiaceae bacterium]